MSLPKKIAAMVAPLVSVAFLLAVPASAQNAPAASPKNQVDSSAPTSEAPKKEANSAPLLRTFPTRLSTDHIFSVPSQAHH